MSSSLIPSDFEESRDSISSVSTGYMICASSTIGDGALITKNLSKILERPSFVTPLGVAGSVANTATGALAAYKAAKDLSTAITNEDEEGIRGSVIEGTAGLSMVTAGTASAVSTTVQGVSPLVQSLSGPFYCFTSLLVLIDGVTGLHASSRFRTKYLQERLKAFSARNPSAKDLLASLKYLQTQLFSKHTPEELANVKLDKNVIKKIEELAQRIAGTITFAPEPKKGKRARNAAERVPLVWKTLILKKLRTVLTNYQKKQKVLERRKARLSRRISPELVEELVITDKELRLETLPENSRIKDFCTNIGTKKQLNEDQINIHFNEFVQSTSQAKSVLEELTTALEEFVAEKDREDNQQSLIEQASLENSAAPESISLLRSQSVNSARDTQVLQQANRIDRLVRKSNLQKCVIYGLLIVAALIGIASFIVSILLGNPLPGILVGIVLGLTWGIIDTSMAKEIIGFGWSCYDPVILNQRTEQEPEEREPENLEKIVVK